MTSVSPAPIVSASDLSLLRGKHVYLQFAGESDRERIRPLAKDERIWEFTKTLLIDDGYDAMFDRYFDDALALGGISGQAFVIRAIADGRTLGMTRFLNIDRKERRLEIGHTWYIPEIWGKVYNKECKLLLLQLALETLGYNRVEFRVAHQNLRSQKAVGKIGGIREGVLRKHMIRNDGSRRDTVVFSIINDEWPETKRRLQAMIAEGTV